MFCTKPPLCRHSSHAYSDVMHTAEYIPRSTVGAEEDGGFLNNLAFGLKHL